MLEKNGHFMESVKHIFYPIQYELYKAINLLRHRTPTNILLACFPKSASTFISEVVGEVNGFRKVPLHRRYGRVEQDIDQLWAMRFLLKNTITQQHVKYNEQTRMAISLYNLTPVVLVRNIFDIIVSMRDHIRKESFLGPSGWVDKGHLELSDNELDSFIVDIMIPWYLSFFVSWKSCEDACFFSYEELVEGKQELFFTRLFEVVGFEISDEDIKLALEKANNKFTRFNVGITGRGKMLSKANKQKLLNLCSHYPNINFSQIGVNTVEQSNG